MKKRILIPALILIAVGCATTKLGRVFQGAGVLVAANKQVQDECSRSKAQGRILAASEADPVKAKKIRLEGLPPFTKKTCVALAASYKLASKAAKEALRITADPSAATPIHLTAYGVEYIYTAAVTLSKAGVKPAAELQRFLDVANQALLRATEVK